MPRADQSGRWVNTLLPKGNVTQPLRSGYHQPETWHNHSSPDVVNWRRGDKRHDGTRRLAHTLRSTTSAAVRIHRPHPSTISIVAGMGEDVIRSSPTRSTGSIGLTVPVDSPPLNYKREEVNPAEGDPQLNSLGKHTHEHTHDPETWDPCSLSRPFVTPTTNLSARAQELELDVGTFSPNQYTSCVAFLHYHPNPRCAH